MRTILDETIFIILFVAGLLVILPIALMFWLGEAICGLIQLPFKTIDILYKKLKNY